MEYEYFNGYYDSYDYYDDAYYRKYVAAREERNRAEQRIADLTKAQVKLQNEIDMLKTAHADLAGARNSLEAKNDRLKGEIDDRDVVITFLWDKITLLRNSS